MNKGKMVISLDFELHWGAVEKWPLESKTVHNKFLKTRDAVFVMLELFSKYKIHVTWATVGYLFAKNIEDLNNFIPKSRPEYSNKSLSTYDLIDSGALGVDEKEDPLHFANSILELIRKYPYQEIGSHTFSHYYTNENGQTIESFEADLICAQNIASFYKFNLRSLVFPRNQFNNKYLEVVKRNDFEAVRSNPNVWYWSSGFKFNSRFYRLASRLARGVDLLLPISNTLFSIEDIVNVENNLPVCIPSSRFVRPYKKSESIFNWLRLRRIKSEMTNAAKNGLIYHLWWHPHNLSDDLHGNSIYLEKILDHFHTLKNKYGFDSANMHELSELVRKGSEP